MHSSPSKRSLEPLTSIELKLIFLLAAINFTHILDFVIIMPLGDQLRDELSITPRQFGFLVSAYGIAATVAGVIASTIIDRFDRRSTMLTSLIGFIVTTIYCGLAPNFVHMLAARALSGLFGGIVASTVMAFVVDLIPPERRGRAIGIVTSSFAVASTIGLPIGLSIANWFHRAGTPFLFIAGLASIVWFFALVWLPSLPGISKLNQTKPMRMLLDVVRQANHLWSFAFMLAMIFGTFMIVPYVAPYLESNCGIARSNLPIIYSVAGGCTLIVMSFIGTATDRFGPRRVFILAAGSAIVMTLVITNLPTINLLMAIVVTSLFMSVASSRMVPAQAMMLRTADPKARGAFTSLNTAVSHFATGVGPLIAGSIVGEEFPGGPLTNYWMVGIVAASFGTLAIILSFQLRENVPDLDPIQ